MPQKRVCSKCKKEKNLTTDFYPQSSSRSHRADGYLRKCKKCTLEYNKKIAAKPTFKENVWANKLQYRYGITVEDYNFLLQQQNYSCAICKTKDPSSKRKSSNKFHVDHCHSTGKVRGLLCNSCNAAIGYLNDDENNLIAALRYLRRSQGSFKLPSSFEGLAA
jgi:hypothetical protein